jgi:hypothetical protein
MITALAVASTLLSAPSLPPETVTSLFGYACKLYGRGCDLPPPQTALVSNDWLQSHVCPSGKCGDVVFWGWYNDDGTVYLLVDKAKVGPLFDGVVVHEMIHYLQHQFGTPTDKCERERQAYSLQDRYLTQRGIMTSPRVGC